eukprot:6180646-Pleurochrysis_carterae.AAC.2
MELVTKKGIDEGRYSAKQKHGTVQKPQVGVAYAIVTYLPSASTVCSSPKYASGLYSSAVAEPWMRTLPVDASWLRGK